ncbi:MAG: pyridoxamine 5'-phosphate oxidase family protein [Deltaproteobacteria bacterium]|nr:pyridoxamine 5'-phosphate oxidase family protein [Deltaproteobacteria bacterium]
MMDVTENWEDVKELFKKSFKSSFHYAIATVNEDGGPHVTPIGSLILGKLGYGFYFEEFPRQLPNNFKINKQVCVLAVNSSRWFWFKSLVAGRFSSPPAVRLHGTVGEIREATEKEIKLWHNRVKPVSFSKGHAMMWTNMKMVREIEFTRIEPVHMGEMTRDTWNKLSNIKHA